MVERDDAFSRNDFYASNPNMGIESWLNTPQEAHANLDNLNPQQQNVDGTSDSLCHLALAPLTNSKSNNQQDTVNYEVMLDSLLGDQQKKMWSFLQDRQTRMSLQQQNQMWHKQMLLEQMQNQMRQKQMLLEQKQNQMRAGRYSPSETLSGISEVVTNTGKNSDIGCSKDNDVSRSVPSTPSLVNHSSNLAIFSHGGYDQDSNTNNICFNNPNSLTIEECQPQLRTVNARARPLKRRKKNFHHKLGNKKQIHSIEHHSSNGIRILSLDSDGDEALSSESKETQSELPVEVNERNHEVHCRLPETGMVFSSEEEAYNFYKNYAAQTGFIVRKGKVQRLSNGNIRKRDLFCSKEGYRSKKQSDKTTKYKRTETRTGCKARIQFTVENGKWVVSHIILEHNHDLGNSSQRHMVDSWNKISETHSSHTINEVGIAKEAGAAKLFKMDYSNYLRDRKLNSPQPEHVQNLINHLKCMLVGDPSFFYTVQVDAENRVTNFFWRDGRSKMDYDYFGDVLILDTTFRVDIYDMICAPFLGLNHHRNYVLFGCAFLLDETVDSYNWLFETFLKAMGHRRPKTIFTDECQASANAIEEMLPDTPHRLYPRYICQNAAKRLPIDWQEPDFQSLWNRSIFDCQSREEFESTWDSLLEQYNLRENPWLKSLYLLWDKWSHLSVGKTFSAGIQSTKDAVIIIPVFQNMTGETMSLPKFAQQYERAAEQRRILELGEDFDCNESPSVMTNSEMEKQAADVYTLTMFKLFQGELFGCLSVAIEELASDGMTDTFKLTEHNKKEYIVAFNCSDSTVSCSCEKFESVGILCLHALKVLNAKNIFQIPPQYILKRWTKHAKSGVVLDDYGGEMVGKSHRPLSLCTSKLMHIAQNVITKSAAKEESMKIAEKYLYKALKEVEDVLKAKPVAQKHMSMSSHITVW